MGRTNQRGYEMARTMVVAAVLAAASAVCANPSDEGSSVTQWEQEQDRAIAAREVAASVLKSKPARHVPVAQDLPNIPVVPSVPERRPVERPLAVFANASDPFGGIGFAAWKAEQVELMEKRNKLSKTKREAEAAASSIPQPQPQFPVSPSPTNETATKYTAGPGPSDYNARRRASERKAAAASEALQALRPAASSSEDNEKKWQVKSVDQEETREATSETSARAAEQSPHSAPLSTPLDVGGEVLRAAVQPLPSGRGLIALNKGRGVTKLD